MADLAFLLIIVVSFAALAVVAGWLDRALVSRPVPGVRSNGEDAAAEVRR
ncbi:MAG: hypothetical protein U0R78_18175 [Nocardioidaceae bacterium]